MKRVLLVVLALSLSLSAKDPRLQEVTTIFVQGNSEAATHVRKLLVKRSGKGKTCLRLMGKAEAADAVLEIAQDETGGDGLMNRRRDVVSGVLTLADGDLVWSKTRRFQGGAFGMIKGSKNAAKLLVGDLEKACDCKRRLKGAINVPQRDGTKAHLQLP